MTTVATVSQPTSLPISKLVFDSEVQCRESIQMGTVAEYKDSLAAGVVFPPLVVFSDGKTYWVADGFHRGQAYRESGAETCPCDVRLGTKRDAILYAVGANQSHGLRRTNADKRRAVETLLRDAEWSGWTDREIARRAGVDHTFVGRLRSSGVEHQIDPNEPRKAIRNGKEYEINTSNIGKAKPEPKPEKAVELAEEELPEPQNEEFGEEEPASTDDRKEERDEVSEAIKAAKSAISSIWFRCPPASRWRLKAGIENHLADLSE